MREGRITGDNLIVWRKKNSLTREEAAIVLECDYTTVCRNEQRGSAFASVPIQRAVIRAVKEGTVSLDLCIEYAPEISIVGAT